MDRNHIIEVSKQEVEELFHWLFGEKVAIKAEQDITLCPYYEDSNIYFTEEIEQLFQTKAMKRLGKILHLGRKVFQEENTYHTRLEHSKGAYRRCVEFLAIQYRDPKWREYIEKNRLKGYLVEKIKFMCVHDLGHFMLSHSTEELVGDEDFTHEEMGQKILEEDPEIKSAFHKIKAKESHSNLEGDGSLNLFCEGTIDFDRMDYMVRDRIYLGEEMLGDLMLRLCSMCHLKWVPREKAYRYVYEREARPYIEKFIQIRDLMYKNEYTSKITKIGDSLACYALQEIKEGKIGGNSRLKMYLDHMVGTPIEEINTQEYLDTNDILFFKELMEIEETSKNAIAQYLMPSNKALVQVAIALLNPQDSSRDEYNEVEREWLKKVRSRLKKQYDKKAIEEIIFSVELQEDRREEILKEIKRIIGQEEEGIYSYKRKFKKYKKQEPIYIEDEEIYRLDEYPNLQIDLSEKEVYGVYILIPQLRENGIEEERIQKIKEVIGKYQQEEIGEKEEKVNKNRMSMFRVSRGETNYLKKLNEFFGEEGR